MQAAVLREPNSGFDVVDVELAPPAPGEVCVSCAASGVCHSDWNTVTGDTPSPLPAVLGHEGAGVVETVGGWRHQRRPRRSRGAVLAAGLWTLRPLRGRAPEPV